MPRKKKEGANQSAEAPLPLVKTDAPEQSSDVIILPPEQPKAPRKLTFNVSITRDGIKDKDGKAVEADGNIYAKLLYENEGEFVDIARTAGRIAQLTYDVYRHMSKGVNKRFPFMLKLEMLSSEGPETLRLNVQSRINNPIDTAFAIAEILNHTLSSETGESLITGNFEVTKEGRLLNQKIGLPVAANMLPYYEIEKLHENRRKQIKRNVQLDRTDIHAKMGIKKPVKKVKPVAPAPVEEVASNAAASTEPAEVTTNTELVVTE